MKEHLNPAINERICLVNAVTPINKCFICNRSGNVTIDKMGVFKSWISVLPPYVGFLLSILPTFPSLLHPSVPCGILSVCLPWSLVLFLGGVLLGAAGGRGGLGKIHHHEQLLCMICRLQPIWSRCYEENGGGATLCSQVRYIWNLGTMSKINWNNPSNYEAAETGREYPWIC